jgi:uncharacterized membrane protein
MADATEPLLRFLHIFAGIMWIGMLYFFNFANLPLFKFKIENGNPEQKAGPHVLARTIFWFRWGAMFTLIFGLLLMDQIVRGSFAGDWGLYFQDARGQNILVGAALGIIMWFNVWFIIWPAQKVIIGNNVKIAAGVPDEDKKRMEAQNAGLMPKAKLASRINTWFSFPMLFFMVFAHQGYALW